MDTLRVSLSALMVSGLMACGGGGNGGEDPDPIPIPQPPGIAEDLLDMSAVSVDDQPPRPADWYQGATFMEIYVRGYQDSDGDGIGDFQGLTSRLDYIADLGIEGIWLMPMLESSDKNHGYEVVDYRRIESDYGSREDFEAFLQAAHERGIGVIIDYVLNHSSGANPLFLDADNNLGNKRDWYVWRDTAPSDNSGWVGYWGPGWHPGKEGFYYGIFQHYMPDFNLENDEVMQFHHNNLRYWLNAGVDGFRFDAVGVLVENGPGDGQVAQPENRPILYELQQTIMQDYSNRYLVCEDPNDPMGVAANDACGSAFSFGLNYSLMGSVKDGAVTDNLNWYLNHYPLQDMGLILANHDSFAGDRVMEQFNGNLEQYKLASATLLTLPGQPFIYYGEEIGMAHSAGNTEDYALRGPMSWTASGGFTSGTPFRAPATNMAQMNVESQQSDPSSLLNHYKTLIQLRKTSPALRSGELDVLQSDSALAYTRTTADEQWLILLNYANTSQSLQLSLDDDSRWQPQAGFGSSEQQANSDGVLNVTLAGSEIMLLKRSQ